MNVTLIPVIVISSLLVLFAGGAFYLYFHCTEREQTVLIAGTGIGALTFVTTEELARHLFGEYR